MKPHSLQPLIDRHLDGATTPEETSRLALALLDDPEAAQAYAEATRLQAELAAHFRPEAASRQLAACVPFSPPAARRFRPARLAAAAAAVLAGGGVLWWQLRPEKEAAVVKSDAPAPRTVTDAPPPPPPLRRPGTLSAAAAEVKRLAARYWLPDEMVFDATPLQEAVVALQSRAAAVNHRKNEKIAAFAIDLPEDVAALPVTARRADLPLGAWLELVSSAAGCDLRWTEEGVAFEPVDQPDRLETRTFRMPVRMDMADDGETRTEFPVHVPATEAPAFAEVLPAGPSLAALWGVPLTDRAKMEVRRGRELEVRHTRRELRRVEGLLAVATADAGRPRVTFRTADVAVAPQRPAVAPPVTTWDFDGTTVDFILTPEVVEFEGFVNYGTPLVTQAVDVNGKPQEVVVTESRIEQPAVTNWMLQLAPNGRVADGGITGNSVLANEVAVGLLSGSGEVHVGSNTIDSLIFSDANAALSRVRGYVDAWASCAKATVPLGQEASVSQGEAVTTPDPQRTATVQLLLGKAVLSREQQQWAEAENAYAQVLALDPYNTAARRGLESVATASGRPPRDFAGVPTLSELPVLGVLFTRTAPVLKVTARREGELLKLTGSYDPATSGGAATDFQAWVGEGQSFVLQTEDAPAPEVAQAQNVNVLQGLNERPGAHLRFFHAQSTGGAVEQPQNSAAPFDAESVDYYVNGISSAPTHSWSWLPPSGTPRPAGQVKGVLISPVEEWPDTGADGAR